MEENFERKSHIELGNLYFGLLQLMDGSIC